MKASFRHIIYTLLLGSFLSLMHTDSVQLLRVGFMDADLGLNPQRGWVNQELGEPSFGLCMYVEYLFDDNHYVLPELKPTPIWVKHCRLSAQFRHHMAITQVKAVSSVHVAPSPNMHLPMHYPTADRATASYS